MRLLLHFIPVPWNAIKLMTFEWIAESHWHLRPVLFKGESGLPLHAGSNQSHSPFWTVNNIKWKHGKCVCFNYSKKENLSSNCSHFIHWKPMTFSLIQATKILWLSVLKIDKINKYIFFCTAVPQKQILQIYPNIWHLLFYNVSTLTKEKLTS